MARSIRLAGAISICLLTAHGATAQQPQRQLGSGVSLADVTPTPTPEMWMYMHQIERDDNPKLAVRRKAIERAQQRRSRIATARWYGVVSQRPSVTPTPYTSDYWANTNADVTRHGIQHVTEVVSQSGQPLVQSKTDKDRQTVRSDRQKTPWPARLVRRK